MSSVFIIPTYVTVSGVATGIAQAIIQKTDLICRLRRWMRYNGNGSKPSIREAKKLHQLLTAKEQIEKDCNQMIRAGNSSLRNEGIEEQRIENAPPAQPAITLLSNLLSFCSKPYPLTFKSVLPPWARLTVITQEANDSPYIRLSGTHLDGSTRLYKYFPLAPNGMELEDCPLKSVISHVAIARYLHNLREGCEFACPNFPTVHSTYYLEDKLSNLHDVGEKGDQHERSYEQHGSKFAAIEYAYCGVRLTEKNVMDSASALSIVTQMIAALAVAEAAFQFEHRDLNIDRIYVEDASTTYLMYALQNVVFSIRTMGQRAFIADFDGSRILGKGDVFFTHIPWVSKGKDSASGGSGNRLLDKQDVYNAILNNENSLSDLRQYHGGVNTLWLKHLIDNLLNMLAEHADEPDSSVECLLLHRWSSEITKSRSAEGFLQAALLNNPLIVLLPNTQE